MRSGYSIDTMIARYLARLVCVAAVVFALPVGTPAWAAPQCSDVEVVFARGTAEPPGFGVTGMSFLAALRLLAGTRSVGMYAVNYAASSDFNNRVLVLRTVVDGIRDTQAHIEAVAANCPGTRIVLGGYSQGAVVAGFATLDGAPAGVPPAYAAGVPAPMPPWVAAHVAAVVLFGKPSDRWMRDAGAPPITIGPLYAGKTANYCIPGDTICDGGPLGEPNALHSLYAVNGMTVDGAGFAIRHL
ncbi:cutinase [Nocardia sp. GAS34]